MSFGSMATPQVSAQEAMSMLQLGSDLLDVREADEWQAGRAPGARHIPLQDLPQRLDVLDRDRTVLVICRSGRRSDSDTAYLRQAGFDARNVAGGMQAWQQVGGDVLTPTGDPGCVI